MSLKLSKFIFKADRGCVNHLSFRCGENQYLNPFKNATEIAQNLDYKPCCQSPEFFVSEKRIKGKYTSCVIVLAYQM